MERKGREEEKDGGGWRVGDRRGGGGAEGGGVGRGGEEEGGREGEEDGGGRGGRDVLGRSETQSDRRIAAFTLGIVLGVEQRPIFQEADQIKRENHSPNLHYP